jgi:type IV secretion system protein VirB10
MPEAVPDLVIPASPAGSAQSLPGTATWPQPTDRQQSRAVPVFVPQSRSPATSGGYAPQAYPEIAYPAPPPPPLLVSGQQLPPGPDGANFERPQPASPKGAGDNARRITAGRLENPATTVVQGTLINAVMETALDSTRPGQTRALVTRDVYGFDGARLLIPRGTRLYGTYQSDIAQGQKRAQIRWTRLLRPDGVSVALDSPAADPLGRAGVEGRVNNHFIQRLGNALVGTTASIGSALVTRSIASSSPVVVAVPGGAQTATQSIVPSSDQIAPTLTVRQGTRITVFVQHDLDFTSVDEAP